MNLILALLAWFVAALVIFTGIFWAFLKLWIWLYHKVFTGEADD